jgi:Lar family restriction alleviation protein
MSELLPCPFCGCEANLDGNGTLHYVKCARCGSVGVRSIDKDVAIDAWNTRAERTCDNCAALNKAAGLWAKADKRARELEQSIVRCKDCRYLCDDGSTWGCGWHCSCLATNDGMPPDGFCAWGERREA